VKTGDRKYRALISSDWNECLAPSGPFDFISFTYPSLDLQVGEIFKAYTGNHLPLSEATRRIADLLPRTITEDEMDDYLDERFVTYQGVPELIEWCTTRDILFMINTTGMQGYFQRVFKKGLLPKVPVVSAHPLIRFNEDGKNDCQWFDLLEIQDKPRNTRAVMGALGIPPRKVVLIGDSGGDGPHFEWGTSVGAFLVGSMTKWSLDQFCSAKGIEIDHYFGLRYLKGEKRKVEPEMTIDFMGLIPRIDAILMKDRTR
jgi:2-hydroxy-3-keto-5-methylthiopentenyl-1-phosphate phosphatase